MGKVTFEYDTYEEGDIIKMTHQSLDMAIALGDIYNLVRSELKHGDEELSKTIDHLLEQIKELSGEYV